jgi:hypothetical protein
VNDGKFDAKVRVGDMKHDFPFWISSQEHHLAIFTSGCTKCNVRKKWEALDPTRVSDNLV